VKNLNYNLSFAFFLHFFYKTCRYSPCTIIRIGFRIVFVCFKRWYEKFLRVKLKKNQKTKKIFAGTIQTSFDLSRSTGGRKMTWKVMEVKLMSACLEFWEFLCRFPLGTAAVFLGLFRSIRSRVVKLTELGILECLLNAV
jgi:hypothetical protein